LQNLEEFRLSDLAHIVLSEKPTVCRDMPNLPKTLAVLGSELKGRLKGRRERRAKTNLKRRLKSTIERRTNRRAITMNELWDTVSNSGYLDTTYFMHLVPHSPHPFHFILILLNGCDVSRTPHFD
jgi:hypothetical protein